MMPSTQLPTDVRLATDAPPTTPRPTSTLSGAASEITGPPKRARSALRLAIAGALAMATGGIGAALTFSGPSRNAPASATHGPAAASSPAPHPAMPAPDSATSAPTGELRAPAAQESPAAAPAAITPPPAARADKSAQQTIIPAVAPRSAAPTPTAARPPAVTPAAKPIKKPARKDKAAGSASENKDLLEQDI
jgi:hypothetical protein